MIYVLKGSLMNGTVTISNDIVGIQADTFADAIKKVKNLDNMSIALDIKETIDEISFYFDGQFKTYYTMNSTPMKVF